MARAPIPYAVARNPSAPATLSAYQPTLRNKLVSALLGDESITSPKGQLLEKLFGPSVGAPSQANVADLVQPFLSAQDQGRQLGTPGQRIAGGIGLGLSALPIPGAVKNKLVAKAAEKAAVSGLERLGVQDAAKAAPSLMDSVPALAAGKRPLPAGEATLADILDKAENSGVKLHVSEGKQGLTVSQIVVPKEERSQGIGSDLMKNITDYADMTGQRVMLSPSGDFGGSVPRLKKFYGNLGFKPNVGKSRDLSVSEAMIREPMVDKPDTAPLSGEAFGQPAPQTPQIVAYHGSPHDFDKFDLSKIGTGEGAQGG